MTEEKIPLREDYLSEQHDILLEKLITLGGKAYPKYGNIVIMAGGAGSGKGFVKNKLLGMEGYSFDVDELKKLAVATPMIQQKIAKELGVDIKALGANMRDSKNVAKLHEIINDYLKLDEKRLATLYTSILTAPEDRKPNIIFDVTLKSFSKLMSITRQVKNLGYDNKNIHIVWVVNDVEVAMSQNKNRDRLVATDIFITTHEGASQTMNYIVSLGKKLTEYMDGDIVFAFNKAKVDSTIAKSDSGGMYVKDANFFYVKKSGQQVMSPSNISKDLIAKIKSYVPKTRTW
jgi:dephospho-CoA kinase